MARARFIDKNGAAVFEVPYSAYSFSDSMCLISTLGANAQYGYMNKTGDIIVQPKYVSAGSFTEGLAYVASIVGGRRRYGYIDHSGNLVIKMQFGYATPFNEGLAAVRLNGQWGFINPKGKVVIKPRSAFKNNPRFNESLSIYQKNDLWGFINKRGKFAIKPIFSEVRSFSEDLAAAAIRSNQGGLASKSMSSNWGFIDKRGKWIIKPIYTHGGYFHEGLVIIWDNSRPDKAIDKKGNMVVDFSQFKPMISDRTSFNEGVIAIKINNKWGFIDKNSQLVIDPIFEKTIPPEFSEGLCSVKIDKKSCFIDKSSKIVIESDAFTTSNFSEGLAVLNYL